MIVFPGYSLLNILVRQNGEKDKPLIPISVADPIFNYWEWLSVGITILKNSGCHLGSRRSRYLSLDLFNILHSVKKNFFISFPSLTSSYPFGQNILFTNIKAKKLLSFLLGGGKDNDVKSSIGSHLGAVMCCILKN